MKNKYFRLALWTAVLLAVAGLRTPLWAQQIPQDYGPHMWDGFWHVWFFGPIMMVVFIAALVLVIAILVRWLGGAGHPGAPHVPPGKTPLDILKERFARGEIDKEEFEERRRVLGE